MWASEPVSQLPVTTMVPTLASERLGEKNLVLLCESAPLGLVNVFC